MSATLELVRAWEWRYIRSTRVIPSCFENTNGSEIERWKGSDEIIKLWMPVIWQWRSPIAMINMSHEVNTWRKCTSRVPACCGAWLRKTSVKGKGAKHLSSLYEDCNCSQCADMLGRCNIQIDTSHTPLWAHVREEYTKQPNEGFPILTANTAPLQPHLKSVLFQQGNWWGNQANT